MLRYFMRNAEAQSLHQRLLAQRVAHRQAEYQLAVLLAELADRRLFAELGYASVGEYGMAVLDLSKRTTRDLVRIGRRLDELPALAEALAAGALDWTKAREIVSIATPETAGAWVEHALAVSSRVLERDVAHTKVGDPPPPEGVPPERGTERVRVVLEMQAADAEVLYQAIALCRAQSDLDRAEIDDGALVAIIANNYVHAAGAREDTPTGERYRIVIHQCSDCGIAESPLNDVSDTVVAEARCDAEVVDMRPGESEGHAAKVIAPAARRKLLHRAGWRCEAPGCCNRLWLDVHHLQARADGGGNNAGNLVVLCCAHHRAIHLGGLALAREPDGGVVVTHREGRRRGCEASPDSVRRTPWDTTLGTRRR